ncbi:MAG: tRNA 2-thiouridine(34) synthase MnmA [Candidatus Wolfebacteria bacterium]|nr:tRNA 2-thiouridine(34) synthase MnmA [Candidatus Wolfebacteria bacterium]
MNRQGKKKKVFIGMSGGVDSSVAAYLLKKQGYDVVGVFMRSYNLDGCAERDAEDARRVAENIGIPFYAFDFEEEYKKKVVEYMIDGYRRGITPNPDVMCNKEIKFGIFLEKALEMGADFVATGHYVGIKKYKLRIKDKKGSQFIIHYSLFSAADKNKDQSYFLWTLTQEQLRRCLFPLGNLLKSEVREIARKAGLPTAEKKDSQGICFLGKVSLEDFLKDYIKGKPGEILDINGKKIGEHQGAHFYTIGQRHGLDLGGKNYELGTKGKTQTKPHYIAGKNIKTNTIIVAEGDNNPALYRKEIELTDVNFINPGIHSLIRANKRIDVLVRVRYRQPLVSAILLLSAKDSIRINQQYPHKSAYRIIFDNPIKFVAPGQSAVFYSISGEMLGGGVII